MGQPEPWDTEGPAASWDPRPGRCWRNSGAAWRSSGPPECVQWGDHGEQMPLPLSQEEHRTRGVLPPLRGTESLAQRQQTGQPISAIWPARCPGSCTRKEEMPPGWPSGICFEAGRRRTWPGRVNAPDTWDSLRKEAGLLHLLRVSKKSDNVQS